MPGPVMNGGGGTATGGAVVRGYGGTAAANPSTAAKPQAAVPAPAVNKEKEPVEIPEKIYDPNKKLTYTRGRFLGKGGFARCYEVADPSMPRKVSACKVVNKSLLVKPHQREKMAQEITIHRDLKHEFVVDFQSYFEDDSNVYIMLELCGKKSLMELQKRRRVLTEPEARYFLRQIVLAVQYLHDEKHIIHRDLKLGNIFITDSMQLKIGDFGLATHIDYDGERKRTLCGTPNYIAPEVLAKRGHSYEVDIWSIGCILYTLLVGKPPFETSTLRETYHKIRRGDYFFPPTIKIGTQAKALLRKLLQVEPSLRPTAAQILASDFLTQGLLPPSLPTSILTMAPRFESTTKIHTSATSSVTATASTNSAPAAVFKKPLLESNQQRDRNSPVTSSSLVPRANIPSIPKNVMNTSNEIQGELTNTDILELMKSLRKQIHTVVNKSPPVMFDDDEAEDPSLCPMLWICKWVDYSDKYGFGYQLSDDSIGVSFNDQTKVILLANSTNMHFIEKDGTESYHTIDNYPGDLEKKVKLLNYFQQYMRENLLKANGGIEKTDRNCIARLPNLWTWFRTSRAVVMVLSNGTLQINNFRDHSKIILCPLLGAISTLGSNKSLRTYKLASMDQGATEEMMNRLKYALEKTEVVLGNPKYQPRRTMISSPMKKK